MDDKHKVCVYVFKLYETCLCADRQIGLVALFELFACNKKILKRLCCIEFVLLLLVFLIKQKHVPTKEHSSGRELHTVCSLFSLALFFCVNTNSVFDI